MIKKDENVSFAQKEPSGGDFLQSSKWLKFQESVGKKTHSIEGDFFSVNFIEHKLPFVGKYLYAPRGPILEVKSFTLSPSSEQKSRVKSFLAGLIELAKKEDAGWIRIEPQNVKILNLIKENISEKVSKAPHDMQPKEVFVINLTKNEEQLLGEMKSKTRYNIKLAQKHAVSVQAISNLKPSLSADGSQISNRYIDAFLKLTREMAARQGITTHPEEYYRKMIEQIPGQTLKLYVAEFENEIIAANLVVHHEDTAIYLHGASGNEFRNLMAPFLLQWHAILDAKKNGCTRYDFGGVKTAHNQQSTVNNWEGITNFKLGFSPQTKPLEFPGSYDIIINPRAYAIYRGLQRAKAFAIKFRK